MANNFIFESANTSVYNVGDIFAATLNKKDETLSIHVFGNMDSDEVSAFDISSKFSAEEIATAYLLKCVCFAERVFDNNIKTGFDKVTGRGKYGFMPSECRSKFFGYLRRAVNNTIYVVVSIDAKNGLIECSPVIASSIGLAKTNLGMSNKKFFEECQKAAKYPHVRNWLNMARATMAQSNTAEIVAAVKRGETEIFDGYMPVEDWSVTSDVDHMAV